MAPSLGRGRRAAQRILALIATAALLVLSLPQIALSEPPEEGCTRVQNEGSPSFPITWTGTVDGILVTVLFTEGQTKEGGEILTFEWQVLSPAGAQVGGIVKGGQVLLPWGMASDGESPLLSSVNEQGKLVHHAISHFDICDAFEPEPGSITIIKEAGDDQVTVFSFGGDLGSFTLTDGGEKEATDLDAGDYAVTETVPADWTLEDVSCSSEGQSAYDYGTANGVTVTLAEGDDVTCTFTNRENPPPEPGSITIIKEADPADGTVFSFVGTLRPFELSDPGTTTRAFTGLGAGTYTVTEPATSGWNLDDVSCRGRAGTSFTYGSNGVTITLTEGGSARCVFTNRKTAEPGSITVVKSAVPVPGGSDDQDFEFGGSLGGFTLNAAGIASKLFGGLAAGDFTIEELGMPLDVDGDGEPDWDLSDIACTSPGESTYGYGAEAVEVALAEGDDVTCTFTNTGLETLGPQVIVGDLVWEDLDRDGHQDPGEPGIPGITVHLARTGGRTADPTIVATAVTDADGRYLFVVESDAYGEYQVRFIKCSGMTETICNCPDATPATDSDAGEGGWSSPFVVDGSVPEILTLDAGLYRDELPFTGEDLDRTMTMGAILAMAGAVVLGMTRRRREQ